MKVETALKQIVNEVAGEVAQVVLEELRREFGEAMTILRKLEAGAGVLKEGWLNSEHAQAYADLTEDALEGMVRRGEIPCYRFDNGRRRFKASDFDARLSLTSPGHPVP